MRAVVSTPVKWHCLPHKKGGSKLKGRQSQHGEARSRHATKLLLPSAQHRRITISFCACFGFCYTQNIVCGQKENTPYL